MICVLFSIIAAVFCRTSLLFLFLLPCPIRRMPRFCMVCFLFFIVSKGFFCCGWRDMFTVYTYAV